MNPQFKAFVIALKEHLLEKKPNYLHHTSWNGGSDEGYYSLDSFSTLALMNEIDSFEEKYGVVLEEPDVSQRRCKNLYFMQGK